MTNRIRSAILSHVAAGAALLTLASLVPGCGNVAELRPPEILYGQQECEHCRMIVSDERFATALIADRGDGRPVALAFDDLNCMFDYEADHPTEKVLARYVHDAQNRNWLAASEAVYLLSERLSTPMASGVAASASREGLAAIEQEHGGTVLDFAAIQSHFTNNPLNSEGDTP